MRVYRWYLAAMIGLVLACSNRPHRVSDWSIVYEDMASGRIAVCDVNGEGVRMLTPDSLRASMPAADSTGAYVIFAGTPRDSAHGPYTIYRIGRDGSGLERIAPLPFEPISLTISPGGRFILFGAKYPDDPYDRLYLIRVGEPGFRAIVPGDRPARDPVISPIGLNFVFDLDPPSDTGWVGFVSGERPMPIYGYTLRQGTFHPSGECVVGVCDPSGEAFCQFRFRTLTDSVVMTPAEPGTVLAHPAYSPDGGLICFEYTLPEDTDGPALGIYEPNTNGSNELYPIVENARRPAWIRSTEPGRGQID